MAVAPADLAWIRDYVAWTPPTDDDLSARWDLFAGELHGQLDYVVPDEPLTERRQLRAAVAAAFVRAKRNALLDEPASFKTDDYAESAVSVSVFDKLLEQLDPLVPAVLSGSAASGSGGFGRMVRPNAMRCPPEEGIDPYRGMPGHRY